jgi:hypothetical protein
VVKFIDFVADHDRMARVRAALVAYDDVFPFGQQIHQFSFGFIAPLQSDYALSWHPDLLKRYPKIAL